jgi:Negative regulator of beta-lactamase expression
MSKRRITVVDSPSPNFSDRRGQSIQFLIQHYTAMATAEDALKRLTDPNSGVSSHYLVGEDGTVWQLVDDSKAAWHAGVSYWDGKGSLNFSSIGIEIANDGNSPYPKAQMDAVNALSLQLVRRHKIRAFYVIGHQDIAPDRKPDPGPLFDWAGHAAYGVGVWPSPVQSDYDRSASWTDKDFVANLGKYGWKPGNTDAHLIAAFQRHFQQDVARDPAKAGVIDAESKARLACLLRRKASADKAIATRQRNKQRSKSRGSKKR